MTFAPPASDEGAQRQRDFLEGHEEAGTARDVFGVEDGRFAAVLVGKDATAKFRSGAPAPAPDLFARIDAMPMRRRGVREKDRPGVRVRG